MANRTRELLLLYNKLKFSNNHNMLTFTAWGGVEDVFVHSSITFFLWPFFFIDSGSGERQERQGRERGDVQRGAQAGFEARLLQYTAALPGELPGHSRLSRT